MTAALDDAGRGPSPLDAPSARDTPPDARVYEHAEAVSADAPTEDSTVARPRNTLPPPTNYEHRIRDTATRQAFDPLRSATPRQRTKFVLPDEARRSIPVPSDAAGGAPFHLQPPGPPPPQAPPQLGGVTPRAPDTEQPFSTEHAEQLAFDVLGARRSPPFAMVVLAAVVVATLGAGAIFVLSRSSGTSPVAAPSSSESPSAFPSPLATALPTAAATESPASAATPGSSAPHAAPLVGAGAGVAGQPATSSSARRNATAAPSVAVAAAPASPPIAPAAPTPATAVPHPATRASNVPPGMEFLKHDL